MKIVKAKILKHVGLAGITVKPYLFVVDPENKVLVNHERIHYEQQQKIGLVRFVITYWYQCLKYGYTKAPLELEAAMNEKDFEYHINNK